MIISLVRDGHWNSLESYCNDSHKKTSDPAYMFWRGFAQYQLGNPSGAINDLLSIQQKKEISYACIVALLFYQNQARNIDRVFLFSFRKKSITSALDNAKNVETLLKEPQFMLSTFSPSSDKHAKLTILSRKKEPQVIQELQLFGPTFSMMTKDQPVKLMNSSNSYGTKRIKIYPKPYFSWPARPIKTTGKSMKTPQTPSMRVQFTIRHFCLS